MFFIVKILVSAVIIGGVTEVAKRFPTYGGIIAALPLVSLLSILWLFIQGQTAPQLSRFIWGVVTGLPATIVMLVCLYIALRMTGHLAFSLLIGVISWLVFLFVQQKVVALLSGS